MRAEIANLLRADATLAGLLPGGIYDGTVISRQATPGAFDASGEIRPCALVRSPVRVASGPTGLRAVRETVQIFYYAAPAAAIARAYTLLHAARVAPASGGAWAILHADTTQDTEDPTLRAPLSVDRFLAYYTIA